MFLSSSASLSYLFLSPSTPNLQIAAPTPSIPLATPPPLSPSSSQRFSGVNYSSNRERWPSDDLYKYERELLDQYATQAVAKRMRLDLNRHAHDRAFACDISKISEEWRKVGDDIQRLYGEGSSSSSGGQGSEFRVYVKGLVERVVGGVAVAIHDDNDGLVFELSKGLSGKDQNVNEDMVELKALIGGLDATVMLELKRVTICYR